MSWVSLGTGRLIPGKFEVGYLTFPVFLFPPCCTFPSFPKIHSLPSSCCSEPRFGNAIYICILSSLFSLPLFITILLGDPFLKIMLVTFLGHKQWIIGTYDLICQSFQITHLLTHLIPILILQESWWQKCSYFGWEDWFSETLAWVYIS